jgi:RNA polymerase sigma factor (sigma-70 family)
MANSDANVLLVTATQTEAKAVLDTFRAVTDCFTEPETGCNCHYRPLGKVNGSTIYLSLTEMGSTGPGASLLTVTKGIEALNPEAVVMVGIAFGMDNSKQAIGDILVSQQLSLYELRRQGKDKTILRGDKPHASSRLFSLLRGAQLDWKVAPVHFGLVLTGEKLVDNLDYREQLRQMEPEAIGGEMEGAGLYVACQDKKVDWILVKAICDWADGNKAINKADNQAKAAQNAAQFVLHALQQGQFRLTSTNPNPANESPVAVELIIDTPFPSFSDSQQQQLLDAIRTLLNLSRELKVITKKPGSVKLTIEMLPEEAEQLIPEVKAKKLAHFKVIDARIVEKSIGPTQTTNDSFISAERTSVSLLQLAIQNDSSAWKQMNTLYQPMITRWLHFIGVNSQDVEDLNQEVMVKLYRGLPTFSHRGQKGAFRAWLKTITRHCVSEYYRRPNKHQPVASGGSDFQMMLNQLADPNSDLSQQWDKEHDQHVLRRLLTIVEADFDPQTKSVFHRLVFDQIPPKTVASEFHMKEATVYAAKSRVLQRLRKEAADLID